MHHVYGKTKNPVFFMGRFGKKIPGFTNINSIQGLQAGFYPKDFFSLLKFQYQCFSAILSGIGSSLMSSSLQLVALPYKIEQLAFVHSSIDSSFSFCSNLSSVHLKPLWSETAEARGCKVFCCLYSTNLIFPPTEVQPHVPLGWQFVSWNEILVWDEQQAQYLRSILPLKSTKLVVVGPIPFVDKNRPKAIRENKKKIISVFSVTPRRLYRFAELASGSQYYQGAKSIEFLRHIGEVTQSRGFKCCLKEKREFGNNVNKSYLNEVRNLNTMGWTIYPSDWSTTFLIKNSDLVICLPFTSVALEAKILDVAAVFYDPGGDIIDPQRYSHGVPVVGSKKDLSALIETLI
jgi:polysaccharide biosynthesis PFTS motif protein